MMNAFGHHCLYYRSTEFFSLGSENSFIPFCIRRETQKKLNDEHKFCYGDMITFKKLKSTNISVADLFQWNAVIETIDLYEKYLLLPNLISDNELYCKCSSLSQFGKSCQYKFSSIDLDDDERSLTYLLENSGKSSGPNKEIEVENIVCYIGIQCENNLLCLDWRQICNGIVDCDRGEDELFEHCLHMELNECNTETEFRCKNGLCIPISFAYDGENDCLDQSDEIHKYNIAETNDFLMLCYSYPDFECEEFNHGWKRFSCGNGQSISYSEFTSGVNQIGKTCRNKRNLMYLKQLFSSTDKNQCWKSMLCLIGFDYLYSNISCLNQTIELNNCPNEYYFPTNSVIYSFVFFLYEKINRTDWFNYTGPNYICYKKEFCDKNISVLPTILKNNLTCFSVNQKMFSWTNFYEYIIYLFKSCYLNFQTSAFINDKMLYKCNLSDTFISKYRVKDKRKDCFFNEDENPNINLCSLNLIDHFKCLSNEKECIREAFLTDNQYDCKDGSDEYLNRFSEYYVYPSAAFQSQRKIDLRRLYRFTELCDYVVNRHLFSDKAIETDETDCEYWPLPCKSPYTECNNVWNCKNGLDELNCRIQNPSVRIINSFHCNKDEHYCIQLINNNDDINTTCIHINKTGDGIIDCIGGTDERLTTICTKNYSMDFRNCFYCMNSSICIRPDQVCDRIINCPFEDDERVCPWLFKSNSSKFYCNNSLLHPVDRCDTYLVNDRYCQLKEHLWFCDLQFQSKMGANKNLIEPYPEINQKSQSISFESVDSNKFLVSKKRILSSINTDIDLWLCNQGYPMQSLISNNKSHCLCSPPYYGDRCQYQSERLTVLLQMRFRYYVDRLTVFRLIIYLLNENNVIISHDEIVYNEKKIDSIQKTLVYLLYERMDNISIYQRLKSKSVRIDSYIIKETNVQYISSWLFLVSFPFLPVNRLTCMLHLEGESFKITNCKKKCGRHGKCMYYLNSIGIEYCWCEQGWYGEKCHLKSSLNLCNQTSCTPHSQCFILNNDNNQTKCICPLGKSGGQCYIRHNSCSNVICQNNGTCLPLDQRNFGYVCICQDGYYGTDCEELKKFSSIFIPANISYLTKIPAIIVTFGSMASNTIGNTRRLYTDILLPYTIRIEGNMAFGFIQMFHNFSTSFYYMIAVQQIVRPRLNTSVISSNLCPNVSELFNETILYQYSYLKRLKLYHLPCNQNKDLRCFFDDIRICFCTRDHNSDCYLIYYKDTSCDYCKNRGLCLRQDPTEDQWNYKCLCPECSFGNICQFSTGNYFITLDILIGIDVKKGNISFNEQSFIIYVTLIILILILVFSLIFNTISIVVFSNKKLRQVGCDLYLLNLTIISQIGLIVLFLRFLYMIIIQIYIVEDLLFIKISCILLEYLVRLIPSLFDWLTVCISIERAYTVIKNVQFTKLIALKTLKISRWMILIILLFNILTTLHRPFYLTAVDEPILYGGKQDHPWCVLDFNSNSWNIYEKFINIFHLVTPLILNITSIVLFLSHKIKLELISTVRKTESGTFFVIKQQLSKYKSLFISTLIIIVLEIPRFVLTFAFACIRYDWQRYVYLTGYLISFLPLTSIIFIYIIPSPKYKQYFRTIVKKRFPFMKF